MMKEKDRVKWYLTIRIYMKDSGSKDKRMDTENIYFQMGIFFKETSKMV